MIWIDDETAILKDTSIINFMNDGNVEMHSSKEWVKNVNKKNGFINFYKFKFNTKYQAIMVFIEIENYL